MSTLYTSAPGALSQNEINRQNQNRVIVDTQMSTTQSAMISALAALERTTVVSPRKQQHVIVVGAGISGLRAASCLQRHGIAVTILEGRSDHIGGRIRTSRRHDGKAVRDIGKYT